MEPGFDAKDVLTFSVPLPFFKYRETKVRVDFYLQLGQRLEALPGVEAAGTITPLPLYGRDQYYVFSCGQIGVTEEEWNLNRADYRWGTPGYFKAMSIRLLADRLLNEADNQEGALDVVLIDEKLARRTWPDDDAVDKLLRVEQFRLEDFSMDRTTVQVVGVVEHVRTESLAAEGREAVYFPLKSFAFAPQSVAMATTADPRGLVSAVRREIQTLHPDVPVAEIRLMEDYVSEAMAQTRFTLTLITSFAGLALVLASIGLYGVISYSVHQRTKEIGVRMAFGAQEKSILRLVLGQGVTLAVSGVGLGLLVAFLLTRLVSTLLFEVTATDPGTFAVLSLLLIGVAVVASYVPARRAMRVDPLQALQGEQLSRSSLQ